MSALTNWRGIKQNQWLKIRKQILLDLDKKICYGLSSSEQLFNNGCELNGKTTNTTRNFGNSQ